MLRKLNGGEEVRKLPDMDYSKLRGRIREFGYTQQKLASTIGISEGQLSQKMQGNYPFKQSEIEKICCVLEIDSMEIGSYFFTPRVEKTQLSPMATSL